MDLPIDVYDNMSLGTGLHYHIPARPLEDVLASFSTQETDRLLDHNDICDDKVCDTIIVTGTNISGAIESPPDLYSNVEQYASLIPGTHSLEIYSAVQEINRILRWSVFSTHEKWLRSRIHALESNNGPYNENSSFESELFLHWIANSDDVWYAAPHSTVPFSCEVTCTHRHAAKSARSREPPSNFVLS